VVDELEDFDVDADFDIAESLSPSGSMISSNCGTTVISRKS
jgi:hypothetical protein